MAKGSGGTRASRGTGGGTASYTMPPNVRKEYERELEKERKYIEDFKKYQPDKTDEEILPLTYRKSNRILYREEEVIDSFRDVHDVQFPRYQNDRGNLIFYGDIDHLPEVFKNLDAKGIKYRVKDHGFIDKYHHDKKIELTIKPYKLK